MVRYCIVGFALLTVCGQARAQSITISTATAVKDKIFVTGMLDLAGKADMGATVQIKLTGTMNPYKDYGSIVKKKMLMGGAWSYEAETMISVPKGTYDVRMSLTGYAVYSSPPKVLPVPGP